MLKYGVTARGCLRIAALLLCCACRRDDPHLPTIVITSPVHREVIQRDERDAAVLRIRGAISGDPSRVEARLVVMPGGTGKQTAWVELPLPRVFGGGALNGRVPVFAGGWYALEVRAWKGSALLAQARVEKIGVGEILVIAGQSNAANSGSTRLRPAEDRVSTWNRRGWSWAGDPQPLATGREGSPWPRLGDLLVRRLQVPVGIVSVAVGGSPIHEWLYWATWRKHGECYVKFREALRAPLRSGAGSRGPRAVLWHQGETDVEIGTSTEVYARKLAKVIAQSRREIGRAHV